MKKHFLKTVILCATILPITATAGQNISIGAKVGNFGIGASASYKIGDQFGIRAGFDMFSINDFEVKDEDVTYVFDAKVQDFMGVVDWHPFYNSFKASAGLIVNGSNLDGELTPNSKVAETIKFEFNGIPYEYELDKLGSISTIAEFDPVAPYIGIGIDTSFNKDEGFGFIFDLGIAFQGSMKTDYSLNFGEDLNTDDLPDGSAKDAIEAEKQSIRDELETELDKEMKTLQDELDKYNILPYVSIGFNYKF